MHHVPRSRCHVPLRARLVPGRLRLRSSLRMSKLRGDGCKAVELALRRPAAGRRGRRGVRLD
eukprot:196823-Rhodomonas_salina.1